MGPPASLGALGSRDLTRGRGRRHRLPGKIDDDARRALEREHRGLERPSQIEHDAGPALRVLAGPHLPNAAVVDDEIELLPRW